MAIATGTAIALAAGIGAAGSITSAKIGSSAANNAAKTQAEAGEQVAGDALSAGERANANIEDVRRQINFIDDARDGAQRHADIGREDANLILDFERQAAQQNTEYERGRADEELRPYRAAGLESLNQLRSLTASEGAFAQPFTAENFKQLDPGYDFRLAEAEKAISRSAFARGSGLSGEVLKELTRYSQDYGSSEFGKAFDRFQSANQQRYNQLMGLTGVGERATAQDITAGSNAVDQRLRGGALFAIPQAENWMNAERYKGDLTMNAAQFNANLDYNIRQAQNQAQLDAQAIAGNARTGAANARAAGTVGAANAWSGAVGSLGSTATNAIMLSEILKASKTPPATA